MTFRRVPMAKGDEQTVAPEGEYRLVIRKVTAKKTKKTNDDMDVLMIGFPDNPEFSPFSHFIVYQQGLDEEQQCMKAREMRRLCHVFDVPWTEEGVESDDFLGAEGTCMVGVETYEPEGGAPRTNNRLQLPRIEG